MPAHRQPRRTRLAIVCLAAAGLACTAQAQPTITNITQNTTHATLADAVAASTNGDTIEIGAGVLMENGISLIDRDLTIRGRGADVTAIDGGGVLPRIFSLRNTSQLRVENITLRNGAAQTNGGGGGGAIRCGASSSVSARDCVFEENTDNNEGFGAVSLVSTADSRFERCVFRNNEGRLAGSLGTIDEAGVLLVGCLFANETGDDAVLRFAGSNSAEIVSCTFADAQSPNMLSRRNGAVGVINSVFDASANTLGGPASYDVEYSLYPGATGNNIDGTPTFVEPTSGNYRLAPGSLGIDAGNSLEAGAYTTLAALGGEERLFDDPDTADTGIGIFGETIDMGAYEHRAPFAPLITGQPSAVSTDLGGPHVSLDVEAPDAATFQWFKDGQPLSDGGNYDGTALPRLFIDPAELSVVGIYHVEVASGPRMETSLSSAVVIAPNECPADFNADGTINTLDVLSFLNAWNAGCP